VTPRVLFVSRERFRLPLGGAQKRKWDAVATVVDHRVLAAAPDGAPTGDERFRLIGPAHPRVLDGALYYALLPWRIARELRRSRPEAALVQGVHEAAAFLVARRLARNHHRTQPRSGTDPARVRDLVDAQRRRPAVVARARAGERDDIATQPVFLLNGVSRRVSACSAR